MTRHIATWWRCLGLGDGLGHGDDQAPRFKAKVSREGFSCSGDQDTIESVFTFRIDNRQSRGESTVDSWSKVPLDSTLHDA